MAFNAELARKQRRWLDLSQEDVAAFIGVGRRTVARWEAGDQEPRADELQKLAHILRLPITDLLPDSEVAQVGVGEADAPPAPVPVPAGRAGADGHPGASATPPQSDARRSA